MKYIILLLLLPIVVTAQDIIDPPSLINDTTANKDVIIREQTSFLIGWNWGSEGIKIDSALYFNFS